jgi:hypothetical protein
MPRAAISLVAAMIPRDNPHLLEHQQFWLEAL